MTQRSVYGEEFTKEVNDNLKEWGIVPVKSIELMDVRDKMGEKVISNIMEKKNLLSTWNRAKKWLKTDKRRKKPKSYPNRKLP